MGEISWYREPYNKQVKEIFLSEIDLSKYPNRWWERLFEKTKSFEEKYGKDFCCFTTPEIIEIYKYLDIKSFESIMVININLIKYGDWALMNGLITDGQNHFSEIRNEVLRDCINEVGLNKSIISLEDLKNILPKIRNEQDRYIFYAVFEGIKGKNYCEIVQLKMDDLDQKNCTAKLVSGRTINVAKDFIYIASDADKQREYVRSDENIIPLIPGEYIYKEKNNSRGVNTPRSVQTAFLKVVESVGVSKYITASSVYNSGFIHYLNIRAKDNDMTVEELFESNNGELVQDIVDKYNFNLLTKKRFILKYKKFLV